MDKSVRAAHVTRGVVWSAGNTLERCRKLRRGSAVASDVTVQRRYGFTVGAKPWRRKRLVTQALSWVCGDRVPTQCGVYCALRRKNARREISPATSWRDLTVRENP
jgi:hypothetical protein